MEPPKFKAGVHDRKTSTGSKNAIVDVGASTESDGRSAIPTSGRTDFRDERTGWTIPTSTAGNWQAVESQEVSKSDDERMPRP